MNIVGIVQARTGSSRLPGKVLADLHGRPVLSRVIERLRRCETLDSIVVATTTEARDDAVAGLAREAGIAVYRGPEQDVLARYVGAAQMAGADVVVRVTSDCPLIDPYVVDRTVRSLRISKYDFASNSIERTWPRGLDVEACWADVLYRIGRMAEAQPEREHVFPFIYRTRPDLFLIRHVKDGQDHSEIRGWTLDTQDDLEYLRWLWEDTDYERLLERARRLAP
jgi:spore coat polysaccharide biosynthesis protein SpsF